jgi:thioredoxin-related protein
VLAPGAALQESMDVKNYLAVLALVVSFAAAVMGVARADTSWETDVKKAQADAKSANKLVFLNFTGSDWCGYCIQLDKQILSKPEFKEYAAKNLVLVEVDFPRRKPQSVDLQKQNLELAHQFGIEGFPTIVVLNGAGKAVWRFDGYFPGGTEAFIAELEKARKS